MENRIEIDESTFMVVVKTDKFGPKIITGDTLVIDRQREPKPGNMVVMEKNGVLNLYFFQSGMSQTDIVGVVTSASRSY